MRNKRKYPHMDELVYLRRRKILAYLTFVPGIFLAASDCEDFKAFLISKAIAAILLVAGGVLFCTLPTDEEEEDIR